MISLTSGIERRSNFCQQTKMRGGGQTNFCDGKNLVAADSCQGHKDSPPKGGFLCAWSEASDFTHVRIRHS